MLGLWFCSCCGNYPASTSVWSLNRECDISLIHVHELVQTKCLSTNTLTEFTYRGDESYAWGIIQKKWFQADLSGGQMTWINIVLALWEGVQTFWLQWDNYAESHLDWNYENFGFPIGHYQQVATTLLVGYSIGQAPCLTLTLCILQQTLIVSSHSYLWFGPHHAHGCDVKYCPHSGWGV